MLHCFQAFISVMMFCLQIMKTFNIRILHWSNKHFQYKCGLIEKYVGYLFKTYFTSDFVTHGGKYFGAKVKYRLNLMSHLQEHESCTNTDWETQSEMKKLLQM